jgi:tetratricopeptide (TPR) repeat protein
VSFPFHIIPNGLTFFGFIGMGICIIDSKKKVVTDRNHNRIISKVAGKHLYNIRSLKLSLFVKIIATVIIIVVGLFLAYLRGTHLLSDMNLKKGQVLTTIISSEQVQSLSKNGSPERILEKDKTRKLIREANNAFKQAEKLYPTNGRVYNDYGKFLNITENYKLAGKKLIKTTKTTIFPSTLDHLAYSYMKIGKIDKAIYYAKNNIAIFPQFRGTYFNLAHLYLIKGKKQLKNNDLDNAEKNLDKAFFYFQQNKVMSNENFKIPDELIINYRRLGYEKSKKKVEFNSDATSFFNPLLRNIYFYNKKPILNIILAGLSIPNKSTYFKIFCYKSGITGNLKGKVTVSVVNGDNIAMINLKGRRLTENGAFILTGLYKKPLPRSNFKINVKIKHGNEKNIVTRNIFVNLGKR